MLTYVALGFAAGFAFAAFLYSLIRAFRLIVQVETATDALAALAEESNIEVDRDELEKTVRAVLMAAR